MLFERFPPPTRAQLALAAGCALAGALGLLGGAAGALDVITLLGWLALWAAPAGALCAAGGLALFPFALGVPAAWLLLLVAVAAGAERGPETLLWAGCALGGLFAAGAAATRVWSGPVRVAGGLLLAAVLLTGLAVGGGVLAGGAELARTHPRAAAGLLAASPLVLVFDCAGWDWTHAQPELYAGSGVEWFPRAPWAGNLAGPTVLVVGCLLAWGARARRPAPSAR